VGEEGRAADLVLHSGAVYTVDAARRWAEAVAVAGGRIVAVGSDRDVRTLVGPGSEVVDLAGRLVLPGFQDAHIHAVSGGLNQLRCHLAGPASADRYVERVAAYARDHPDRPWITGGGWSMTAFPGGTPTADLLDAVVVDRPVFLRNADGHGAWVNRVALEDAGIDRDTPDPPDGRIERDGDGAPTGTLHEGAMQLVGRLVPRPSDDEMLEALRLAQRDLHRLGITAWQDAIVGRTSEGFPDPLPAYRALDQRGELTARVVGALWWDRARGTEQIPELIEMRAHTGGQRFQATSVKIMQDGVCENFTAAMLAPYEREGNGTGISFVPADLLAEAVAALDGEGFQVHVHTIGDRAVREALDAIEHARERNGWNDHRHHLAHVQVVHPDDRPRFRALGVTVNAQPLWATHEPQMDTLTIPFLGPERAGWQYPWASLRATGATLAFGSDWPVSSPDPFEQLHVAVNRTPWTGGPDASDDVEPFLPDERLDLPTAVAAFTIGSAYVNHLDADTGSIEPGKAADLVVVDRDLFAGPADAIAGARALLTTVEGEVVHADPGL
jgi:predicted amidohydrolase YtcJ